MVFSSNIFLFYFLPIVLFVYFMSGSKIKNVWLLIVSLLFYFWGEPHFILVMMCSIGLNYVWGGGNLLQQKSENTETMVIFCVVQ